MDIVLASRNKKKIGELRELLDGLMGDKITVLSLDDIGYTGEITEDGDSFSENAVIKASVPATMGYFGVADDSGLCVDCLDGAPGIFSARYSGAEADTDKENNKLLLKNTEGVPAEKRGAGYKCAMALVAPEGAFIPEYDEELSRFISGKTGKNLKAFAVIGECRGKILTEEADGDGGFGYDPLFYVEEYKKTFSQVSAEEKHKISHRGKAMRAFAERLRNIT